MGRAGTRGRGQRGKHYCAYSVGRTTRKQTRKLETLYGDSWTYNKMYKMYNTSMQESNSYRTEWAQFFVQYPALIIHPWFFLWTQSFSFTSACLTANTREETKCLTVFMRVWNEIKSDWIHILSLLGGINLLTDVLCGNKPAQSGGVGGRSHCFESIVFRLGFFFVFRVF